jgi:hypothetical protein
MAKTDTITIKITGTKKFRQAVMDLIYTALMDEDVQIEGSKGNNGIGLESSIEPSEEVML